MNYEEKQERKLERYTELGQKASIESKEAYERSTKLSEMIPFGQPILVGHHSESRHRNVIKKIDNCMDKSIKLQEKSEYYKNKADNILNSDVINSDNPEAITLLKNKLQKLEEQRQGYKEHNKKAKKEKKESLPRYMLSNLSQNIRSVKIRIEQLQELKEIPETEENINGVILKVNKEENRVQLLFDSIPDQEIRTKLKSNGFRWSPYNKAWQRKISDYAIRLAHELLEKEEDITSI